MDEAIQKLHLEIDRLRDQLVEELRGVLRIPSKREPPAGENAPYGKSVREALDYTLELSRRLGFQVKDVGGHAGHAEFGNGDEMVAAVGHLDVVPEGGGWRHEPYGADIDGGYIYARGASDDKGPTYAALFAARAIMSSGLPLKRRIRVIFGCDEESGFGCVHHYWEVAKEERPLYAFTPDACFPMVYAEKGIANLVLERSVESSNDGELRLVSAQGGLRSNMVPERAEARVEGPVEAINQAAIKLHRYWDKNLSFEPDETGITLAARGKSAHGSTPHEGDNAIGRLCKALLEILPRSQGEWLRWTAASTDIAGVTLGIEGRDEIAGPLTSNLGIFEAREGKVRATYNIRYPVTWTIGQLLERARPVVEENGWTLAELKNQPSLYVPTDQEPARTLLRVYREETGDTESKPITMGGGTYARATPCALAFGAAFPKGTDGPAHEPNERIAIDSLVRAAKIYAHALYELAR